MVKKYLIVAIFLLSNLSALSSDEHDPTSKIHDNTFRTITEIHAALGQKTGTPKPDLFVLKDGLLLDIRKYEEEICLYSPWGCFTLKRCSFEEVQEGMRRYGLELNLLGKSFSGSVYTIKNMPHTLKKDDRNNHPRAAADWIKRLDTAADFEKRTSISPNHQAWLIGVYRGALKRNLTSSMPDAGMEDLYGI